MMSDSQANPVHWSLKSPTSTLSAEASPFVPNNFIPLAPPANSEGPCASASAQSFYPMEVPGYYSSLVPTPALPFYAMQYQCMYPPQMSVYPNSDCSVLVPSQQLPAPRQNKGHRQKDGNAQRETRGASDKRVMRNSKMQEGVLNPGTRRQLPERRKPSEQDVTTASKPDINPDLSSSKEFPSLSSSEPERPQNTAAKNSVSYSTALKQQPQKVTQMVDKCDSETKNSVHQKMPETHLAAAGEKWKMQKGQRGRKHINLVPESCAPSRSRNKVQIHGTTNDKSLEKCSRTTAISRDYVKQGDGGRPPVELRTRECWRQRHDRPLDQPQQHVTTMVDGSSRRITALVNIAAATKPERSYAAALNRAPQTIVMQEHANSAGGQGSTGIKPKLASKADIVASAKGDLLRGSWGSMTSSHSSQNLVKAGTASDVNSRNSKPVSASKSVNPPPAKGNPQVRINVSKAKKETHNSALKRNVLKSQQKNVKGETGVKSSCDDKKKKRKKKSPKIPDLMVDKVGMISQELLDFLQGGSGGGGIVKTKDDQQGGCVAMVEDVLTEYPPLEGKEELPEQSRSRAQLGTYSKIVASKMKSASGVAQLPQPVTTETQLDTSDKKPVEGADDKKPQHARLRKLVALGNAPTPMHKVPISMQISSVILPQEKQCKKLKGKENLFSGSTKKEKVQKEVIVKGSANILDSSAPLRKRGKERELPRKKKLSVMKKIILKEREQRKQLIGKMKQAATLRQQLIENSAALEESIVEDKLTSHGRQRYTLHSKNFRDLRSKHGLSCQGVYQPGKPGKQGIVRDAVAWRMELLTTGYCDHLLSKEINDVSKKLISDLVLFQDRLHLKDPVKARSKRRLVYGLKEVRRYLSLNKLKCIIFAPDIEEVKAEGGLNDSLQDLIDSARRHSVPVVFALKRRALGYYSKKSVPVSCIGIFDHGGREADFRHLIELVEEARKAYSYAVEQLQSCQKAAEETSMSSPMSTTCNEARQSSSQRSPGKDRTIQQSGASETVCSSVDDGWITTNDTDEDSGDEPEAAVEARAAKVSQLLVNVLRAPQK
ncbi:uncharacterized protein LOC135371623 isoform X2 [Ornithodoros turicata]|uniref:uncharacterized protein LOC135371623 isoform X2 n=1 Tax=Ornithodoros turicata TaxID=34597 RepID=UPI0031394D1B